MKLIRLLAFCLIILSLSALVACDGAAEADIPKNVGVEYETLTLVWSEVKGAKLYTVRIESEGKDPLLVELSKNYYSLEDMEAGE